MLAIFEKVLTVMLVLFAFAVCGFALGKTKLVGKDALLPLSNILLCLCQPMLCAKAFAVDPLPVSGGVLLNFLWVFLFSAAAILLTFGASRLLFLFMKKPTERRKRDVLTFVSTFSNCAFVGIPFIDMFTGGDGEAIAYLTVFTVAFNIILWTLGAYLVTQDKKQISPKKAFLNPCTVGSAIGFLLFLVPQINIFNMAQVKEFAQIVTYTGNMTAPLSMMIVGVRLARLAPQTLFGDYKLYLCAAGRLLLSFGLTYLLCFPSALRGCLPPPPTYCLRPLSP